MPKPTNFQGLRARLLSLLKKNAFKKRRIILSSGKRSNFYIDARRVTLTGEGAFLTACIILELTKNDALDAIGGPTMGADPIVGAISALSYLKNRPLKTFIVRKALKSHGTRRQIEGPNLPAGSKVMVVDDVATTGKSIQEAIYVLRKQGIKVKKAVCIVDREEGAKKSLAKAGCELISIFKKKDFLKTKPR